MGGRFLGAAGWSAAGPDPAARRRDERLRRRAQGALGSGRLSGIGPRMLAAGAILLAALAWAPTQPLAHPPIVLTPEQEKSTAEEIHAFRRAMAAAVKAKDVARLREMYWDSFVHTHTTGKLDGRDARIVALLAGDPVIETAPVEELVIRVPGGWTAVATGVSPIRSAADGKTYSVRWTATYVRDDKGDWRLAASHASRVGSPAARLRQDFLSAGAGPP